MAEDQFAEQIIPGTFVRVQAEGLISAGGISSGNIGIVGTANPPDAGFDAARTYNLSDYDAALNLFGAYDAFSAATLNLTRGIEILFRNGARTVYARALAAGADQAAFSTAYEELLKDNVNILVAPELGTDTATAVLGLVNNAEDDGKDLLAVIGSGAATPPDIIADVTSNKRFILVGPGIRAFDAAAGQNVSLPGTYSAAAVAGLLSSLAVQTSPTNKVLGGVTELAQRFSYGEMRDLVQAGVVVLEDRRGIRVVRGVTTQASENGPFSQITTRRIVDFAKAGIRQVSNPFIGRLNNQRVRNALQGSIDGFLTTMVQDESLTNYSLQVTATRQDEIAGRANVNVIMQPTFSIDYIRVTLALQ